MKNRYFVLQALVFAFVGFSGVLFGMHPGETADGIVDGFEKVIYEPLVENYEGKRYTNLNFDLTDDQKRRGDLVKAIGNNTEITPFVATGVPIELKSILLDAVDESKTHQELKFGARADLLKRLRNKSEPALRAYLSYLKMNQGYNTNEYADFQLIERCIVSIGQGVANYITNPKSYLNTYDFFTEQFLDKKEKGVRINREERGKTRKNLLEFIGFAKANDAVVKLIYIYLNRMFAQEELKDAGYPNKKFSIDASIDSKENISSVSEFVNMVTSNTVGSSGRSVNEGVLQEALPVLQNIKDRANEINLDLRSDHDLGGDLRRYVATNVPRSLLRYNKSITSQVSNTHSNIQDSNTASLAGKTVFARLVSLKDDFVDFAAGKTRVKFYVNDDDGKNTNLRKKVSEIGYVGKEDFTQELKRSISLNSARKNAVADYSKNAISVFTDPEEVEVYIQDLFESNVMQPVTIEYEGKEITLLPVASAILFAPEYVDHCDRKSNCAVKGQVGVVSNMSQLRNLAYTKLNNKLVVEKSKNTNQLDFFGKNKNSLVECSPLLLAIMSYKQGLFDFVQLKKIADKCENQKNKIEASVFSNERLLIYNGDHQLLSKLYGNKKYSKSSYINVAIDGSKNKKSDSGSDYISTIVYLVDCECKIDKDNLKKSEEFGVPAEIYKSVINGYIESLDDADSDSDECFEGGKETERVDVREQIVKSSIRRIAKSMIDKAGDETNITEEVYWQNGLKKINIATNKDSNVLEKVLGNFSAADKQRNSFVLLLSSTDELPNKVVTKKHKNECILCKLKATKALCGNGHYRCSGCTNKLSSKKITMFVNKEFVDIKTTCPHCSFGVKYNVNGETKSMNLSDLVDFVKKQDNLDDGDEW